MTTSISTPRSLPQRNFPELVRHLRTLRGMTQLELATHAGLSVRSVQRFETSTVYARPHPRTLDVLADALLLSDDRREALVIACEAHYASRPIEGRSCTCGCACCERRL